MKKYFFVFLVLVSLSSFGQQSESNQYADSLETLLRKPLSDTTRAKTLFLLSQYWADLDSAKGVHYAEEALKFNPNGDYYEGEAHYYLGSAFFEYDIPRAQREYMIAEKFLRNIHTREAYALSSKIWHNYGALEERSGKERSFANILLNNVIPLATKAGDTSHIGIYYMSLGVVFINVFDYDKSIQYYKKAIAILKNNSNNNERLMNCYAKIAENYLNKENYGAAKPFLDSAKTLLNLYPQSIHVPSCYLAEGRYYNGIKNYEKALESFEKGIRVAETLKRFYDATSIMMEQSQTYKAQKKYTEAKKLLLKIYTRPYVAEMPENMLLVLRELARTDSALNNPKAANNWLLKFIKLSDSLSAKQTDVQIKELEAKYNYSEKGKEILRLNEKAKMQRLFLWSSLALLILTALLFIYFYKQRRIKGDQQIKSLRQEQQIAVAQALLNGEERERGRLARDLHDGLGGMLAGVKINLSEITPDDQGQLNKVISQLDNSVTELRRIARNMMPEALLRSGLETALHDLCQSTSTDKMNVEFQTLNITRDLSVQVQLIIYRIVQELLTNVVKHAAATEVFVQCSQLENIFYITIEDNGQGFNMDLRSDNKGIGMANIRNRVEFLQGKMDIRSSPEKGTAINIELVCRNS
nr:sensor histidine kinase [Pedobacter panaciterrae]